MIALAFLAGLWTATRRARARKHFRRENRRHRVLAHGRRDRRRARRLCGDLLEGRVCPSAVPGNLHDPARRTGLLRRPDRRDACRHHLHPLEKTAAVENRRRARAEHRAGQRLWPHRLPAERLLLRPRLQPAVGHPVSRSGPSASVAAATIAGASDGNLRRAVKFRPLSFSGVAVPAQKIQRPGVRHLSHRLRRVPFPRGICSAAIIRRTTSTTASRSGQLVSIPIFIAGLLLAAMLSRRAEPKRG